MYNVLVLENDIKTKSNLILLPHICITTNTLCVYIVNLLCFFIRFCLKKIRQKNKMNSTLKIKTNPCEWKWHSSEIYTYIVVLTADGHNECNFKCNDSTWQLHARWLQLKCQLFVVHFNLQCHFFTSNKNVYVLINTNNAFQFCE